MKDVSLRISASLIVVSTTAAMPLQAQEAGRSMMPQLHHVGLNSVDPERAIEWYLRVWPSAKRTEIAGQPAVAADMLLLFNKVDTPPAGAWRHDLHRSEPQSAFWHIGAFTNTTDMASRLQAVGVTHLPLFTSPQDARGVWRSGMTPYAGTLTAKQLDTARAAPPRQGGFSYVVAPDGVLFEFTGGPATRDSFSHVHSEYGEAGWPSLEQIGTIRQPSGNVRFGNGSMSWYPRQCVGSRCSRDRPLAPSRGQALDHVAFTVHDFDRLLAQLRRDGVKVMEGPYEFGDSRALMIEDPDRLAIELIDGRVGTTRFPQWLSPARSRHS